MRTEAKRAQGFTLIEIMAVVVIIGLLMGIVGTAIVGNLKKARVTITKTQMNAIDSALSTYSMDNGHFPSTDQGLRALIEKPSGAPEAMAWQPGGYLAKKELPKDGWGNPFHYAAPGEHNADSYDLWSNGEDGQPGGTDYAADIGNWPAEQAAR